MTSVPSYTVELYPQRSKVGHMVTSGLHYLILILMEICLHAYCTPTLAAAAAALRDFATTLEQFRSNGGGAGRPTASNMLTTMGCMPGRGQEAGGLACCCRGACRINVWCLHTIPTHTCMHARPTRLARQPAPLTVALSIEKCSNRLRRPLSTSRCHSSQSVCTCTTCRGGMK
jgi:hypothetical protein